MKHHEATVPAKDPAKKVSIFVPLQRHSRPGKPYATDATHWTE